MKELRVVERSLYVGSQNNEARQLGRLMWNIVWYPRTDRDSYIRHLSNNMAHLEVDGDIRSQLEPEWWKSSGELLLMHIIPAVCLRQPRHQA